MGPLQLQTSDRLVVDTSKCGIDRYLGVVHTATALKGIVLLMKYWYHVVPASALKHAMPVNKPVKT